MGFLDSIERRNTQAKKAEAYDKMVKENEHKIAYQKGLADSANEIATRMAAAQQSAMPMPAPVEQQPQPQAQVPIGLAGQSALTK